ncbi:hypothetical protein K2O51_27750 [Cupriavidus pinatubonensis]|uniref:hypothetical protein n=1 Tax=Cupriavidus pinatubonensis TaxID=248026 RepID=UPI00112DD996|nr:hypothetical protein [Cupriavidus pinatubonensis]QYY31097.1 hypothetical protein K2O51_27750 [Cupriavidus pinatubonensis]TPQ31637.1 hypothetical protein C2U69_28430 [Cupriavidus pinatubonensis]
MKTILQAPKLSILLVAVLLGACGSQPSAPDASAAANADASADNGWQALRARYMDCVQHRADDGIAGKAQTKEVVSSALAACNGELKAMHDAFGSYLDGQMVSSHGKSGARQAADRVTTDTREKARSYLTRYVERERYVAHNK